MKPFLTQCFTSTSHEQGSSTGTPKETHTTNALEVTHPAQYFFTTSNFQWRAKNIFGLQNVTILNTISWDHSNGKISTNKYSNFINS